MQLVIEAVSKRYGRDIWALRDFRLTSVVPFVSQLLRGDLRGMAYAFIKGGNDQLYVTACVGEWAA